MSLRAVTCANCGGAVALEVGAQMPRCLFCGSDALSTPTAIPEEIEPPHSVLGYRVDEDGADAAFRAFARSSFWYPNDIREARLELRPLLLPAWVWSGHIETHYTALVSASTRSGSRPVAGHEALRLEGVLVPASTALSQAELRAISPFQDDGGVPFDSENVNIPYELGTLTRTAATQAAIDAMQVQHQQQLFNAIRAQKINVSCLHNDLDGRPVLLPIYIGAYRRGDNVYRIVINGQTGKLTGDAPLSWLKIIGAILAAVGCLGAILLFIMILSAIASQL